MYFSPSCHVIARIRVAVGVSTMLMGLLITSWEELLCVLVKDDFTLLARFTSLFPALSGPAESAFSPLIGVG